MSSAVSNWARDVWTTISRRKTCETASRDETALGKTLGLVDIICLGVVSTLGTGVYVILGQTAREKAGPAVVLSYLYSAVATFLTGLCYSELGARFPRAGSAYVYAYATVGELIGFLIGWSLVLELALGAAVAGKASVEYVDALSNHSLSACLREKGVGLPLVIQMKAFDQALDLPAMFLIVVVSFILLLNSKVLRIVNSFFATVAVLLLGALILVGLFYVDVGNWTKGSGFFPNGLSGILCAASTCTYSFIGYELMAGAAGEAKEPHDQILASAVLCVFVVTLLAAFPAASLLTLLLPFYNIAERAAFVHAFEFQSLGVGIKYLVVGGALGGLLGSLVASLFALSRLIHRMADDGLLFRGLSRVGKSAETPWASIVVSGLSASLIALFLDQYTLVEILGFGTLLASVSVAGSILVLRYGICPSTPAEGHVVTNDRDSLEEPLTSLPPLSRNRANQEGTWTKRSTAEVRETSELLAPVQDDETENNDWTVSAVDDNSTDYMNALKCYGSSQAHHQMAVEYINDAFAVSLLGKCNGNKRLKPTPTTRSSRCSAAVVVATVALVALLSVETLHTQRISYWTAVVTSVSLVLVVVLGVVLLRQPKHSPRVRHKVPCIPALPLGAIWLHVPMLASQPSEAWLRGCVWFFMGIVIYALYGSRHSRERSTVEDQIFLQDELRKETKSIRANVSEDEQ